jgi:hypothetical protein
MYGLAGDQEGVPRRRSGQARIQTVLGKCESCGAQQGGFAVMVSRRASMSRVAGWAFVVSPCSD